MPVAAADIILIFQADCAYTASVVWNVLSCWNAMDFHRSKSAVFRFRDLCLKMIWARWWWFGGQKIMRGYSKEVQYRRFLAYATGSTISLPLAIAGGSSQLLFAEFCRASKMYRLLFVYPRVQIIIAIRSRPSSSSKKLLLQLSSLCLLRMPLLL